MLDGSLLAVAPWGIQLPSMHVDRGLVANSYHLISAFRSNAEWSQGIGAHDWPPFLPSALILHGLLVATTSSTYHRRHYSTYVQK